MDKKIQKIIMVGPVYPYKGGISHYTSLLCKALRKKYNVMMFSYKMQYPKLLFKKEQKDYSNDTFKVDHTLYGINTANPLNWINSALRIRREKPDLVIFQWWHPYFSPCYWFMSLLLGKINIIYICHNVFPHERFVFDHWLTKLALRRGDGYIVQSKMDEADLMAIKKAAIVKRTVHPTYNAFKQQDMTQDTARKKLGLGADVPVLLFFGFVKEYKGLKHLLNALPNIMVSVPNIKLLIVGDFAEQKAKYLDQIEKLHLNEAVDIYDNYIPDREVEKFFAASDLVVLPYESATQSGIVQIAYGFEKAVVATEVGGLPEVVQHNKTGYTVPSKSPDCLADVIIRYFEENKQEEFCKNIQEEAYRYSWDRLVEMIEDVFATI